jgi:hypothetical protein
MTAIMLFKKWLITPLAIALLASRVSHGQQIRRYTPQSPTVSPYLNLLQNNNSGLPNYYSLVRPQLRQRSINRDVQQQEQRQRRQLQHLGTRQESIQELVAPTGTGGWFMAPGQRAKFLGTSQFYPEPPRGRR